MTTPGRKTKHGSTKEDGHLARSTKKMKSKQVGSMEELLNASSEGSFWAKAMHNPYLGDHAKTPVNLDMLLPTAKFALEIRGEDVSNNPTSPKLTFAEALQGRTKNHDPATVLHGNSMLDLDKIPVSPPSDSLHYPSITLEPAFRASL